MIHCFSPAKINLMLHVVGLLDNGYHHLQSLIAFLKIGDHLIVTESQNEDQLTCSREFAPYVPGGDHNSILKAKKWFYTYVGKKESYFHIHLEKNLPIAAGIGGGTSNAAAMIGFLVKWHDMALSLPQKQDLVKASGVLGSDVPVSVAFQLGMGAFFWVDGAGNRELPLPLSLKGGHIPLVLVNPRVLMNTQRVFEQYSPPLSRKIPPPSLTNIQDLMSFLGETKNDLEKPAHLIHPFFSDLSACLEKLGFSFLLRQSGSGSTCFIMTKTAQCGEELAQELQKSHPHWWIKRTRILIK